MSSRLSAHLRSNVIGYVALFAFAMSGSASALRGASSVDSGDIRNNQVRSVDVRDDTLRGGGLRGRDIAPGAIGAAEVAADALGGPDINEATLEANVLQRRIGGECSGTAAIRAVDQSGGVTCTDQLPDVFRVQWDVPAGEVRGDKFGELGVSVFCHSMGDTTVFSLYPAGVPGHLNWLYSDGQNATSTSDGQRVFAGGAALDADLRQNFSFGGRRLEGQWILSGASIPAVLTLNLHVFDGGTNCEVHGTVTRATQRGLLGTS